MSDAHKAVSGGEAWRARGGGSEPEAVDRLVADRSEDFKSPPPPPPPFPLVAYGVGSGTST